MSGSSTPRGACLGRDIHSPTFLGDGLCLVLPTTVYKHLVSPFLSSPVLKPGGEESMWQVIIRNSVMRLIARPISHQFAALHSYELRLSGHQELQLFDLKEIRCDSSICGGNDKAPAILRASNFRFSDDEVDSWVEQEHHWSPLGSSIRKA